jgi:ectoine hydroxylase-related dioxygenase (phytanoyl-CoA dioxygenase family)
VTFGRDLLRRARSRLRRPVPLPAVAWFDAPDARHEIARRGRTPADRAVLDSWVRHGYAIVEQIVPPDLIDEMLVDLDDFYRSDRAVDGVVFHDLLLADGHRATIPHRELVAVDLADRLAARDRSPWRVHGFFEHSRAAEAVRQLPELRRLAAMILGVDCRALYSINFHNGSTQTLHQDTAVFHLGVPNLICGAWIACEDIVEGSGPLVYYPGSHRHPLYEGFDDYPRTNLRTADGPMQTAYRAHVEAETVGHPRETFLARKGDVLLWHGMLIHGGEVQRRPGVTRKSYVLHFIPDAADVADQVTGPVNW